MADDYPAVRSCRIKYLPYAKYSLKIPGMVTLKIFDARGNEVESLISENQAAGSYSVFFDASKLPSGAYYYKLASENFSETKKMVLVK